jgi:hypothetical protein
MVNNACNPSDLAKIYAPTARVFDRTSGQAWDYASFYQTQRCQPGERNQDVSHGNYDATSPEGSLVVLADSCGISQIGSEPRHSGGTFGDRCLGLTTLRVTEMSINNPPPSVVSYSFEDGTVGCWILAFENGQTLGSGLSSATEQRHAGDRSLSLRIDLSRPGEHRARIEH